MKTSRLMALASVGALALALAACGDSGSSDTTTTQAPATTQAPVTTQAPATTEAPATTQAPATTMATDTTMGDMAELVIEVTTQGDSFSVDEIRVAAGQEVTIIVTDKDTETDEPHNFHVRAGDLDFFTNIEEAPNVQTLTFTIETAGTYLFFCDTHADTMFGDFIVEDDM